MIEPAAQRERPIERFVYAECTNLTFQQLRLERRQLALENGAHEERSECHALMADRPTGQQHHEVQKRQPARVENLEVEDTRYGVVR